jgi:acyl-coenzyme A synthetase/AMP-(fatty) acid ligase/3-hydroxymyristoyl/3-hydroxydecanoyl-(acyl carrier protein) dehydratase
MPDALVPVDGELAAQAQRIAALIGPGPGRVVLSCRHADAFVPGLLGAWAAGATVELLPNVSAGTLDRVDADPEVSAILHDDVARQTRSPKAIHVPTALEERAPSPSLYGDRTRWPEIAVRMTTSGTTERPRYVVKTMAELLGELDVLAQAIPKATAVLSTVPLSHLYGLLWGALLPLEMGARIISHEALLPADLAAVIVREGVDLMISTPAHLRAMRDVEMPRGLRVISSGARMPSELQMGLADRHGWIVTDVLGSTETGGIATREHPLKGWKPLPSVTVTAPEGQLVVESPWCARTAIDDRIELRPDGTFQYLGRASELIKVAGKRADAHELEATIRSVPGVTDVAVLVHATVGKEPRVVCAISVAEGVVVGREDVAAAIRRQFDAVFVPKTVKIVAAIPRTDRGKVAIEPLRDLLGLNDGPTTAHIPSTKIAPMQYTAEIPRDLVFFRGHFDQFTILPGAVIVERLVLPIVRKELPDLPKLTGIRRLRFRRPLLPDQQVTVTLEHKNGKLQFDVTSAAGPVSSGVLLTE